ncbi:hypothetical protein [Acaryochloris sp. IP29b_bin.148]|uniref:hypothetical protein n=1 Tax=Acaryochloris sp. IP29b_bin.148 TaxID=2969218 RepID=UPI00262B7282|nr:hypothetical protein [Acaryochloris sp. IP29b_bin.148]
MNLLNRTLTLFLTMAVLISISVERAEARTGGRYSRRNANSCPQTPGINDLTTKPPRPQKDSNSTITAPTSTTSSNPVESIAFSFELIYEENGIVASDLKPSPLQAKFSNVVDSFKAFPKPCSNSMNLVFDKGDFYSKFLKSINKIKYTIVSRNNNIRLIMLVPISISSTNRNCTINTMDLNQAVNDLAYIESKQLLLCATDVRIKYGDEIINIMPPENRVEIKE